MGKAATETMAWISHRGREMLLADYDGLRGDEFVKAIQANQEYIVGIGERGRRDLLILTDVTNATIGPEVLGAFKEVASAMKPFTKASAVVGITGSRKFLLQVVNTFSSQNNHPIDTVDEAKDWLVDQV